MSTLVVNCCICSMASTVRRNGRLLIGRFVAGGDDADTAERRNGAFKLIPKIVKGSWLVKQSVGVTPVLLGRKLTTKYFR